MIEIILQPPERKPMPLTTAEKAALTAALLDLKQDDSVFRTLLALDNNTTDAVGPVLNYITDPDKPGAVEKSVENLPVADMRKILISADLALAGKDPVDVQTYMQIKNTLDSLQTIPLTDEGWADSLVFLHTKGFVTQSRIDSFTTRKLSLVQAVLGETAIISAADLGTVLFNPDGTRAI